MARDPKAARKSFGDIAPALAEYTDDVLFGNVWERPELSPRDRSLITVASLVTLYRTNELPYHLKLALQNGLTKTGNADWFTGTVRIDPLFQAPAPAHVGAGSVTFEPCARTAWHTHPLGQTLVVTAGMGRVQRWGGPIEEVRPGDIVWFPPGEKHWHGASPATAMTHIAIQESLDGKAVEWMEKVSDAQYEGSASER